MTVETTRIGALKDAICDRLRTWPALAGVEVYSAEVPLSNANEYIHFIGEDLIEQAWAAIGKYSRDEDITLEGAIYVKRAGKKDSEEQIREARTRCVFLMGEIEKSFTGTTGDPTVGQVVRSAMARPVELHEMAHSDGGRIALLRFQVRTGKTRLTRA